jgi:hypothetical protein
VRRFLAPLLAVAGLLMSAQTSLAVQQTFAGASTLTQGFVYTQFVGLTVTNAPVFLANGPLGAVDPNSTFTFSGGSLLNVGFVATGTTDVQNLTGGSFTLTNSSAVVLLTTPGSLPQNQASFLTNLLGVTYTGGTYFLSSGLTNPGGFSFGLTSVTPPVTLVGPVGAQSFSSFNAAGSGTFSATAPVPVPEPVTAAMGLTALPALGLWFWMRRKAALAAL